MELTWTIKSEYNTWAAKTFYKVSVLHDGKEVESQQFIRLFWAKRGVRKLAKKYKREYNKKNLNLQGEMKV